MEIYKELQKQVEDRTKKFTDLENLQENVSKLDKQINEYALKVSNKTLEQKVEDTFKDVFDNAIKVIKNQNGVTDDDLVEVKKHFAHLKEERLAYAKMLMDDKMTYLFSVDYDNTRGIALLSFVDLTNTDAHQSSIYNRMDGAQIIQFNIVTGEEKRFLTMPNFMLAMANLKFYNADKNYLAQIENHEEDVKSLGNTNILNAMFDAGYDFLLVRNHQQDNRLKFITMYKNHIVKNKDGKLDKENTYIDILKFTMVDDNKKVDVAGFDEYVFSYQVIQDLFEFIKTVDVFYADKSLLSALDMFEKQQLEIKQKNKEITEKKDK